MIPFLIRPCLECLAEIEQAPTEEELAAHAEHHNAEGSAFKKVMRLRALHFIAFFILIYVGVEVTMGGMEFFFCLVALY
jgi:fucose permease